MSPTPPLSPARVAVLGPGGVGGLLAGLLARRGDQVTCLAPPATAAHLAEHGLELRSPALGDARVRVEAASRLEHPVDVLFVTVKAAQLETAAEAVPAGTLGDGLVVPFLNGIDHLAWLRERYPPDQVVAGTIRVESTRVGPGVIEHASPFAVVELARLDGDEADLDRVVEPGGGLDRHPGVAKGRAAQLQAVGGQVGGGGRRGQAGDPVPAPGQQRGQQPPDPARPQHRHPGRRKGLSHGRRARGSARCPGRRSRGRGR